MALLFLIDDDPASLFFHKKAALKAGFEEEQICIFSSAKVVLSRLTEIIEKHEPEAWPDIICTDKNMPEMSASEFLLALDKLDMVFQIPKIIIATGDEVDHPNTDVFQFDIECHTKFLSFRFFEQLLIQFKT